jgi:hypothetical protein
MADTDRATQKLRAKIDGFLILSEPQRKEMRQMIVEMWGDLVAEHPDWFIERTEKTTDLKRDSWGKLTQRTVVTKLAVSAYVSDPFEDGEIFEEVERKDVWIVI